MNFKRSQLDEHRVKNEFCLILVSLYHQVQELSRMFISTTVFVLIIELSIDTDVACFQYNRYNEIRLSNEFRTIFYSTNDS